MEAQKETSMVYFILGLLFAIPLSVVANLVTPWVKNKYALTSKRRTVKRLKVLENQLADIESRQPMTELMIGLNYLFATLVCLTFWFVC